MDRYSKEVIVIGATMIIGFFVLCIVYVMSGYNNLIAVVGFFILLAVIAVVSKLTSYGDHELTRMTVDKDSIESGDDFLLKEYVCPTCGNHLPFDASGSCPKCGAEIKR